MRGYFFKRDQCYDFKIFSPKNGSKFGKNFAQHQAKNGV
jgi:hypothetical protein